MGRKRRGAEPGPFDQKACLRPDRTSRTRVFLPLWNNSGIIIGAIWPKSAQRSDTECRMAHLSGLINDLRNLKVLLRNPALLQFMISAAVLVVGAQVYLLDRGVQAYFVPDWLYLGDGDPTVFIGIGAHLPSFTYAFAVTMMIAAVLWPWRKLTLSICAFWFGLECFLEIGQTDSFAGWFASLLSGPRAAVATGDHRAAQYREAPATAIPMVAEPLRGSVHAQQES